MADDIYDDMPDAFNGRPTRGARGGLTSAGTAWARQQRALARGNSPQRQSAAERRQEEARAAQETYKTLLAMTEDEVFDYCAELGWDLRLKVLAGVRLNPGEQAKHRICEKMNSDEMRRQSIRAMQEGKDTRALRRGRGLRNITAKDEDLKGTGGTSAHL